MEELVETFFKKAAIDIYKQYNEDGDPIYSTDIDLGCGMFDLCVAIAKEYQTVTVFLNSPITIPEPKRTDVAEYIARANYHYSEGSLLLNFENGQFVFKYSMRYMPGEDIEHIWHQLNNSLARGMEDMQKHFPGITRLVFNDIDPERAFNKVEFGSRAM